VTTKGFIAIADQVSGQNLSGLLTTWLYARVAPPMPPLLRAQ